MLATDLIRFDLNVESESFQYRTPMKFGGRVVTDASTLTVTCEGELRGGHRAVGSTAGIGSMTMGVAWAWPDPSITDSQKLLIVTTLAKRLAVAIVSERLSGHPLEICHQMNAIRVRLSLELATEFSLSGQIPPLAVLLASSPIEASLFDAQGKALGASSYSLLGRDHVSTDLSTYLGPDYSGKFLDQYIASTPAPSMPLYHLVGALDPLDDSEVSQPIADGLPETLAQWIQRDELSHLKIKLAGDQFDWDVNRILGVHRVAQSTCPATNWAYSLDFNERCESADYVLRLMDELTARSPESMRAIQYIEQPTHRDLAKHPHNLMHTVAARMPVVIDESLVDLASLRLAIQQGYSGVALKACKGHAEALLMAAVARQEKLFLCVQDLTCIGISLLHSASLAAHIPGVMAIESNGRQYCPSGNASWASRYPGMFDVKGGQLPTGCLSGPGLGYSSHS